MAHVITKACIGEKSRSCVEVCPVDCFYDIKKKKYNDKYGVKARGEDYGIMMINPDECIDCGACAAECPVGAIYQDTNVPEELRDFVDYPKEELAALSDEELDGCRCTSKL